MIEKLLPRAFHYYINLPITGKIADDFTNFLLTSGYAKSTVKVKIKHIRRIEQWLSTNKILSIHDLDVQMFDHWWFLIHKQDNHLGGTIQQFKKFLLKNKFIKPLLLPTATSPMEKLIEKYRIYLAHQKGFSASTINSHLRYVQRFLHYLQKDVSLVDTTNINLSVIDEFIQDCSKTTNRYSLQHIVAYLRSFLRYLFKENLLQEPLFRQIESPRTYRLENVPKVLPRQIVLALLASIHRTTPKGCRDYAILYLAAHYGLRACEIVALKLENIQWKQKVLLITQRKTGNILYLPLTEEAIEAIGRYIQIGRPNHIAYREVFLRNRAPYGILKPTAIHDIFQYWSEKSGLPIPLQGSHCLRHSLATYLLEQGQSSKMIGDLFGHLDLESTSVYLRVQCHQLRKMVLPIPSLSNERAKELLSFPLIANKGIDDLIPFLLDRASFVLNSKKPTEKKTRCKSNRTFQSSFQKELQSYLLLHQSLGKKYTREAIILHQWDNFLFSHETNPANTKNSADCIMDLLWSWLSTLTNKSKTTRRRCFLTVRKFLLYASRFHPEIMVPDCTLFPVVKTQFQPYRFTDEQVALLLFMAHHLPSKSRNIIRSSSIHLGILLLYVTGMRRGELLRLCWKDYDPVQKILTIRESKFHKSRLLPIDDCLAQEIQMHLTNLEKGGWRIQPENPIIANLYGKTEKANPHKKKRKIKEYTGDGFYTNWEILCQASGITTKQGKLPRLHDLRHSHAMRNLDRFYEEGRNPYAELPILSAYMGHVSIVSTQYYLKQMRQSLFIANEWYLDYIQAEITKSTPTTARKKRVENWIEGWATPSFPYERKRSK
jgi:integrase/recombinase XerD